MEYKDLLELIKTVSDSNIVDFKYEQGDTKIVMCSAESGVAGVSVSAEEQVQTPTTVVVEETPITEVSNVAKNIVKSPLVGTFYVAPAEDAPAFVKVGDTVTEGQTLAIVEAMKLMNEIESEFSGTVTEVYVKNGEMVEYGQPLFAIA